MQLYIPAICINFPLMPDSHLLPEMFSFRLICSTASSGLQYSSLTWNQILVIFNFLKLENFRSSEGKECYCQYSEVDPSTVFPRMIHT